MPAAPSEPRVLDWPETEVDLGPDLSLDRLHQRPLSLAVGMFDGVHRGHQAVLASAIQHARQRGGVPGVLTFWPHPSRLFRPDHPTRMLQPVELKRERLLLAGMQVIIWKGFTAEFAALTAEAFLPQLRWVLPGLVSLHVGSNFRFGRGRLGDAELLRRQGPEFGIDVGIVPRLEAEHAPISSSRIRDLLEAGSIAEANGLLGYTYTSRARLQGGRRLGRQLGFPTLNLPWQPELAPRYGVYVVGVRATGESAWRPAVANYGLRPTVEPEVVAPLLEPHILDGEPVNYAEGTELEVAWHHFIRSEARFSGLDRLRERIQLDAAEARDWWADHSDV